MTPRRIRAIARIIHIVIGLALGTYVYLPVYLESARSALQTGLAFVGIPLATATGLWLWKGHLVTRAVRGRAAAERA